MDFNMECKEIMNNVFHIVMDSQYELTSTFLRLSEFYESGYPGIKGNFFTLEDYMDLYAERNGNFTYTIEWEGFNVPGNAVISFFNLFSYRLMKKERKLLKSLSDNIPNMWDGGFYVIGTYKGCPDENISDHEIAHAIFYLDKEYRKAMHELNCNNDQYLYIRDTLSDDGYSGDVMVDEIQAYMATSTESYLKSNLPDFIMDKPMMDGYRRVFNEYKKKWMGQWK